MSKQKSNDQPYSSVYHTSNLLFDIWLLSLVMDMICLANCTCRHFGMKCLLERPWDFLSQEGLSLQHLSSSSHWVISELPYTSKIIFKIEQHGLNMYATGEQNWLYGCCDQFGVICFFMTWNDRQIAQNAKTMIRYC